MIRTEEVYVIRAPSYYFFTSLVPCVSYITDVCASCKHDWIIQHRLSLMVPPINIVIELSTGGDRRDGAQRGPAPAKQHASAVITHGKLRDWRREVRPTENSVTLNYL